MLSLNKETLTELTNGDLSSVVGGNHYSGCDLASCFDSPVWNGLEEILQFEYPKSCVVGSCITNA